MAIYLFGTSVIIDALSQKHGRWELLASLVEAGDKLACSVVTVTEIYAGIRPKEFAITESFLNGLEYYDLDSHLARDAGLLYSAGSQPGVNDG